MCPTTPFHDTPPVVGNRGGVSWATPPLSWSTSCTPRHPPTTPLQEKMHSTTPFHQPTLPRHPPQDSHDTLLGCRGVHRGVHSSMSWRTRSWRACRGAHFLACRGVHRGMVSWRQALHVVESMNPGEHVVERTF